MVRMDGKVVIVTGAASGIGAETARMLVEEGARVAMTDVQDAPGAELAQSLGANALYHHHDVTDEPGWQGVVSDCVSRWGKLDGLVNNAGILVSGTVESSTVEDFRRAYAVMVEGVFLGCKHAVAQMRGSGGSIVNISSVAAQIGQPHFLPYSAAKGAVRTMTKTIAVHCQMHKYNIRCNSVHPGAIHTPMYEEVKSASKKYLPPEFLKGSPGRRADPSEVANMILYLLSDESRFVTGSEMVIDNGLMVQ